MIDAMQHSLGDTYLRLLPLPDRVKPVEELTKSERLGILVRAGVPVEWDVDPKTHGYVLRTRYPVGIAVVNENGRDVYRVFESAHLMR